MSNATAKRVLIPVLLERIGLSANLSEIPCLGCGCGLKLIQPDDNRPETLIGNCAHCEHNYLIAQPPKGGDALMVLLPDANDVVRAGDY
jgi:hypothetical protein